jgi:hypothetical protein
VRPPVNFSRLLSLGRRLHRQGWKPWSIHSHYPLLRRRFRAAGLKWRLELNPSVNSLNSLLNLWICPAPPPKPKDWTKLDRSPFCTALYRKMNVLGFLKVFGPRSGGRILFFRRITSYPQISQLWKQIVPVAFESLDRQRIPETPPVRGPIQAVPGPMRERLFWELARRCQRGNANDPRSPHLSFGITTKVRVLGHQWTVCFGIYWHRHRRQVDPPSTFWGSLMIWPPDGLSRQDRARLEKIGFYYRISKSLKTRRFKGGWHDHYGGFADFSRHQLQWRDIAPLCDEFRNWSIHEALAETPREWKKERLIPDGRRRRSKRM